MKFVYDYVSLYINMCTIQFFAIHLRLASGIGAGGSSVMHACRIGDIVGSDVFQRP